MCWLIEAQKRSSARESQMVVNEQHLIGVSRQLWSESLGLRLEPDDTPSAGNGSNGLDEPTRAAWMKASGAWCGGLLFECPESVLRHAALMLFDSDADELDAAELDDALTELWEMVGRRLRDVLPEKTKFSKPSVVADESGARLPGELASRSEITLRCEGRPLRFVLLESQPSGAD